MRISAVVAVLTAVEVLSGCGAENAVSVAAPPDVAGALVAAAPASAPMDRSTQFIENCKTVTKAALHNPDSFKFYRGAIAYKAPERAVIEASGTNGFGGVVRKAFVCAKVDGAVLAWGEYDAGSYEFMVEKFAYGNVAKGSQ